MIAVLIHWRIKPTPEAEKAFLDFWTRVAKIEDKSGLVGEFLSQPLPASQFPFMVDDLSPPPGDVPCRRFINIGLWKDWQSFYDQVGKNMRDDKPMLEFEAARRTRTVLEPKQWRIGKFSLPAKGTCE